MNIFRTLIFSALLMLLLSMAANAQQCGTYTGPFLKDGFGPPDPGFAPDPDITLPAESTALALTITAPVNASTVGTRTIQVYGTYAGPPATGVAVNRAPAVQTTTQFVQQVTLKPGSNTITIRATKLTGESTTVTRTVTYDPNAAPEVTLEAKISGEHAPIKTSYIAKTKAGFTITRIQLDYNGDGTIDQDTTNAATALSYTYSTPGFYTAIGTVTLDDGNAATPVITRTVNKRVAIVPLPFTRKTLCYVFYRMKDRLVANDIADALKSLNSQYRAEWQSEFEQVNLTQVAPRLGVVTDGTLGIKLSELNVKQTTDDGPEDKSITFERASDGVWRVTSM